MIRRANVNCQDYDRAGPTCRAGVYAQPSPGTCKHCRRRREREPGPAILPETPTPLTIRGIAHGIAGLAKAAVGADRASDETIAARRETCRACEHNTGGAVVRCRLCGCALRAKTRLAGEHCPVGKW